MTDNSSDGEKHYKWGNCSHFSQLQASLLVCFPLPEPYDFQHKAWSFICHWFWRLRLASLNVKFPAEHKTNSLHEGCIECSQIFKRETFFPLQLSLWMGNIKWALVQVVFFYETHLNLGPCWKLCFEGKKDSVKLGVFPHQSFLFRSILPLGQM